MIPPPRSRRRTDAQPPRLARRREACALATFVGLLAACASGSNAPRDAGPPQVLVEVLPRTAQLSVDGVVVGRGSRVIDVREPLRRYRFLAAAPGFLAAEHVDVGARLAGARVGLVLTPAGLELDHALDIDDGESLAIAAEALERGGDHAAAVEFAQRAATVDPRSAVVERVLRRVGDVPGRGIEVRHVRSPGSAE